ncbi:MAG: transporter substrate-binding domain-containing protein [Polaromonas sp.]
MKFRRSFLLASLTALTLGGANAYAQDNVLRVGTDATFPPMEFVENDKRTGFDIDLVEAIAKTMGKRVEWADIDFKGLIPGLMSKRFDIAVSAIYITDERKKVVDFTDSYYAGGLVVMTKEGNTAIKTLADLDGKKVTVQVGTKSVGYLQQYYPKVQRIEVEKNQEMFNLVDIGRADAAVTGKPAAYQYVRTRPGLRVLEEQLTTEAYGMALRKDTPELTKAVNGAIVQLKADGTYAALVKKWFSSGATK